jgi:hypothetical protein
MTGSRGAEGQGSGGELESLLRFLGLASVSLCSRYVRMLKCRLQYWNRRGKGACPEYFARIFSVGFDIRGLLSIEARFRLNLDLVFYTLNLA